MAKSIYLCLFSWLSLISCHKPIDSSIASNVVGTYELTEYDNQAIIDDDPSGTVVVGQVDAQHITLVVKGIVGKVKINYTYLDVLVVSTGQANADQDSYNLLTKGRKIGTASYDGVSRYLELYPTANITIKSVES